MKKYIVFTIVAVFAFSCKEKAKKEIGYPPELNTHAVLNITSTSATLGGSITNAGLPEYEEKGVCYSIKQVPEVYDEKIISQGRGTGNFTAEANNLVPDTDYYVRAYATSSDGTVYGNEVTFKTLSQENNDCSIIWDDNSQAVKLSHNVASAEYGRMCIVSDDIWLAAYTFGYSKRGWDNIAVRRSVNAGNTWSEPYIIPRPANGWRVCFAEFIKLADGRILLAYVHNNNPETNELCTFNVLYSDDNGITWNGSDGAQQGEAWKHPIIAAKGRGWEPAMIQLEDGTIQMFYASEARWWQTVTPLQQEILMVESFDNGLSWSINNPKRVAYTYNARDGMPVPLILKNNKGALFVIEAVNAPKSPSVIWTPDPENWQTVSEYATGPESPYRWTATNDGVWGGAPYITQFPSGITAISFHGTGYRPPVAGDWRKDDAIVYLGDSNAKNFSNRTYPWPNLDRNTNNSGVIQNAIYALDDTRILLVSTVDKPENTGEVWYKTGRLSLEE